MKCQFSELQEIISHSTLQNLNKEYKEYSQQKTIRQQQNNYKQISNSSYNCIINIDQSRKNIKIISYGGMIFTVPLSQQISQIFILNEGIIIENLKIQNQKEQYNYITINKHPLDEIKCLGLGNKQLDNIANWLESFEKITYVSKKIPIVISYNQYRQRHAFYILRLNQQEQMKKLNCSNFNQQLYLLNEVNKTNTPTIICQQIFEEMNNCSTSQLLQLKIVKSYQTNIFILYLILKFTGQMKIFWLDLNKLQIQQFIQQNQKEIYGIKRIFPYKVLYSSYQQDFPYIRNGDKKQNNININQSEFKDSIILQFQNDENKFSLFKNNSLLLNFKIKTVFNIQSIEKLQNNDFLIKCQNNEIQSVSIDLKLNCPQVFTMFQAFISSIDQNLMQTLFIDCLRLCCTHSNIEILNFNCFPIFENCSIFKRFLCLIIYILQLCSSSCIGNFNQFNKEHPIKKQGHQEKNKEGHITNQNFSQIEKDINNQIKEVQEMCGIEQTELLQCQEKLQLDFTFPILETKIETFNNHKLKILEVLHWLYQDIKLNSQLKNFKENLCYFLYAYTYFLDDPIIREQYSEYYLRERPEVMELFNSDQEIKIISKLLQKSNQTYEQQLKYHRFQNNNDIFELIDFQKWIENKLLKIYERDLFFPNKYQRTLLIYEIIQEYTGQLMSQQLHEENLENNLDNNYPLLFKESFSQYIKKPSIQDLILYIQSSQPQSFQKSSYLIFLKLVKENISYSYIQSFPLEIIIIIAEALREVRNTIQQNKLGIKLDFLPSYSFNLIQREDIYLNYIMNNQKINHIQQIPSFQTKLNQILRGRSGIGNRRTILSDPLGNSDNISSGQIHDKNIQQCIKESEKLLDITKIMRIKGKFMENIAEDKIEQECQSILMKHVLRRLACMAGKGALNYGTNYTYITEILTFPKTLLAGIIYPQETQTNLELKDEKEIEQLTQWPDFHNGVATGLTISQSLLRLNPQYLRTWIFYQRPELPKHEHAGFLLALGLNGVLDPFLPTDIYQYLKQAHEITTIGILLGLSASRIGKVDEQTKTTLCLHLTYMLPPSYDLEIALPVQTAALIGLGLLHCETSNRIMSEMALAQIAKKPISDKCIDREGYALAGGISLGLINLGKTLDSPYIKDLGVEEKLLKYIEGGMHEKSSYNNEKICSIVKETQENINTHITTPAGLFAIALIFLKTNRSEISKKITIPTSFNQIEKCNPMHILLKTLAKNLINWNKIQNTSQFVNEQIPELIKFIYLKPLNEVQEVFGLTYNVEEIDYPLIGQIYANIIGGCLMAMGLKYAGTSDQQACISIQNFIQFFKKIKTIKNDLVNDFQQKQNIDQFTLNLQLSICCISLCLVQAGTCCLKTLKILINIRKRIQNSNLQNFGFIQAINMAIGFLCLGKGEFTFGTSNISIATLLISIFPIFPTHPNDNKYYLQPLRHFYVLAVQRKILQTFDAITQERITGLNLSLEFKYENINTTINENHISPALLKDGKQLIRISVNDNKFHSQNIQVQENNQQKIIFVKKNEFQDYNEYLLFLNPTLICELVQIIKQFQVQGRKECMQFLIQKVLLSQTYKLNDISSMSIVQNQLQQKSQILFGFLQKLYQIIKNNYSQRILGKQQLQQTQVKLIQFQNICGYPTYSQQKNIKELIQLGQKQIIDQENNSQNKNITNLKSFIELCIYLQYPQMDINEVQQFVQDNIKN